MGEFEDAALLKSFGQLELDLSPDSSVLSQEIQRQFQSILLGEIPGVFKKYYAVTVERKIKHPSIVALCGEFSME